MTDWQPGDLALCVKRGEIKCSVVRHSGKLVPPLMTVREVKKVSPCVHGYCKCETLYFTDNFAGLSARFVKVTPGVDINGKEVERKAPKPVGKSEGIVA